MLKKPPNKHRGHTMNHSSLLKPLFEQIDKVVFGIEEAKEVDYKSEFKYSDHEEEFDVERSVN